MDAKQRIIAKARELGFDRVGFARADVPLDIDFERYESFVDSGKHGSMEWLASAREARRRLDGPEILEGAKSVICLASLYGRSRSEETEDPNLSKHIARYARGQDYHSGLRRKIRKLAAFVRSLGSEDRPVHARPMCDDAPVLERAWAARAGLGFVGKNGLLIIPGVGSMVLLGEVVTTLELEPDAPIAERCGACTRCLDACPTQAFERPFVLDARRCIAYLTIEHRSPVEESLQSKIGDHLFGCDDCQTVCPFNASVRNAPAGSRTVNRRYVPDERWSSFTLDDLVNLSEESYASLRQGSAVARATREGLARNAAIVIGNTRSLADGVTELESAATAHESEMVRSAATWALTQVRRRSE